MEARDTRRIRQNQKEYYGITPDHTFLAQEQRLDLMASTREFSDSYIGTISNFSSKRYYMEVEGGNPVDILEHPHSLFRYWKPRGLGKWDVMQDIALFKLDRDHIRSDGLLRTPENFTRLQSWEESFRESYIVEISSEDELNSLDSKRIFCRGKHGTIVHCFCETDRGWTVMPHLSFVLDGNER